MHVARDLNLVIPIAREDETIWAHSAPISYEVFKRYNLVLGKTWSAIFQQGLREIAGPKLAAWTLQSVAEATGRPNGGDWWDGEDGVQQGLLGEVRRLTSVLGPRPGGGFMPVLFDDAVGRKVISEEEADDVLGQAVFFTLAWRAAPMANRVMFVERGAALYGARTTSLNSTDYARSLTTPTEAGSSGESRPAA